MKTTDTEKAETSGPVEDGANASGMSVLIKIALVVLVPFVGGYLLNLGLVAMGF